MLFPFTIMYIHIRIMCIKIYIILTDYPSFGLLRLTTAFKPVPFFYLRVVKYDHLRSCFQPNDNTILYFLLHVEYSQYDYGGITLGGRNGVCQWNFKAQRQQLLG